MLTEMGKQSIKKSFPDYNEITADEIEHKIAKNLPSGKFTDLSEVTNIIDFLLNDGSHNISGEFFRVASGSI